MRNLPERVLLAMALAFAMLRAPEHAQAKGHTVDVPKAAVVSAFNLALSGTDVYLHNYGKRDGGSWLDNRSYVRFPNGKKVTLDIDEHAFKVTKYRYIKHYINDMRASEKKVYLGDRGALRFRLAFESQGEEVLGRCTMRRLRKWKECGLDMERDIELNNTQLEVDFMPVAINGGIAYSNVRVDMKTDLRINSRLCRAFSGICGKIENKIKRELEPTVEQRMAGALQQSATTVAQAVRKSLQKYIGDAKVVSLQEAGSNYRLILEGPKKNGPVSPTPQASSGTSSDLDQYRSLYSYSLPDGRTAKDIVAMAIASDDHVYAWYTDGTVSSGTSSDLGRYRQPYAYALPPGKEIKDIVAMGIASDDHVYVWYADGTVSAGSTSDLDLYRSPYGYKLPPGKRAGHIVGMGIAKSTDHVYAWYADGTVSAGSSSDLGQHRSLYKYSFPPGKTVKQLGAIGIAGTNDHVYAWYH